MRSQFTAGHRQTPEPQGSVYLDNASTAHPKPDAVWESVRDYLREVGASPGRGGYASAREAAELVERTRAVLADLIGVSAVSHVAFTSNATVALNMVIHGVLRRGDHVVATCAEHNSVLRPLHALQTAGVISFSIVACDPGAVAAAITPRTRLVIVNHASNVTGAVSPTVEIAFEARARGVQVLLDASQTVGLLDIAADQAGYDFVAFTGHKALAGPSGIGGFFVRDPKTVEHLVQGGTGTNSQSLWHPEHMPARFEAGTVNYLGIAGLGAAVAWLVGRVEQVHGREMALLRQCADGLREIPGVGVIEPATDVWQVPIVSFTVGGYLPGEVSHILDSKFKIATRPGLHCAPLMHRSLGTAPHGTVRVSLGQANTRRDVQALLNAVHAITTASGRPQHKEVG